VLCSRQLQITKSQSPVSNENAKHWHPSWRLLLYARESRQHTHTQTQNIVASTEFFFKEGKYEKEGNENT
jgi:hypothetical protein